MLAFLGRWLTLALWRGADPQPSPSVTCVTDVEGSQSHVHRCTSFPQVSALHSFISLNFFPVSSQLHHFLGPVFRAQQEEYQCLLPRPYPRLSKTGVEWGREGTFSFLWFSKGTSARKATVLATSEIQVPVFAHKKGTHPTCCMVLPGCHIVMDNCALLSLWLITESQTSTFKVTRNKQVSPVGLWQSLLTVCWRGNQFAAALVKTLQAFLCHASLYLLMVVWSYVIVYSFSLD